MVKKNKLVTEEKKSECPIKYERVDSFTKLPSFVKSNNSNQENKIRFKTQDGDSIVTVANIMFCMADDYYSVINIAESRPIRFCCSLKTLKERLALSSFVRCHHSYLVNIDFIKKIKGRNSKKVELIDGTVIPCSRRKLKDVIKAIDAALININFSDN